MWIIFVIISLVLNVMFNQFYKILTKTVKNEGALTALLDIVAGVSTLILIPFFAIKFPTNLTSYLLWGLAIVFYAINNRLYTTARRGMEISTFTIVSQVTTVFNIIGGFIIFSEPFIINKLIGAVLIILSNVFMLYKKGSFKIDKCVILNVLGSLVLSAALMLDVYNGESFTLPVYVALNFLGSALLIIIFEKIKIKVLKKELIEGNKTIVAVTGVTWSLAAVTGLIAYQLGSVTIVAPLLALAVILNTLFGFIILKEKENLIKKIIAASIIVLSVVLINM